MGKKQKKPGKGKEKTERKTAKGEEKRARREARKVDEEDDIEAILVGVLSFPPLSMCSKLGHAWCSRGCSFWLSVSLGWRRLKSPTLLRMRCLRELTAFQTLPRCF